MTEQIEQTSTGGLVTLLRLRNNWSIEKVATELGIGFGRAIRLEANRAHPSHAERKRLISMLNGEGNCQ